MHNHKVVPVTGDSGCVSTLCLETQHEARDFSHEWFTQVYLDNASTTKMSKAAIEAMLPFYDEIYGNPSSLHRMGQRAKEILEDARASVARCLGAAPGEIIFTSGGSEADNQAIVSAARYGAKKGKKHIITTAFEHHAVLHTVAKLE